MNNRLYCTFVSGEDVNSTVDKIRGSYSVLFNKIFVLESLDGEKLMLTYNVDMGNSSSEFLVSNTILVHRKKQTNTLYTINALNELIKSLNNGYLDKSYKINWNDYKKVSVQNLAFMDFVKNHKHKTKWIAKVDIDEFIYPKNTKQKIKDELYNTSKKYFPIPRIDFGNNNHITKPNKKASFTIQIKNSSHPTGYAVNEPIE